MRHRTAHTVELLLQALADGSTWLLFRGTRVRC